MLTAIEKSGTGIEKSGTGIEKSGTGIEKSGTGLNRTSNRSLLSAGLIALSLIFSLTVQAAGPRALISEQGNRVQVSLHTDQGIYAGAGSLAVARDGLIQIDLHSAMERSDTGQRPSCQTTGLMTQGSGTGSLKPCPVNRARWGQAEIVTAPEGLFVLISRDSETGPIEVLAEFQARSSANEMSVDGSGRADPARRWLTRH